MTLTALQEKAAQLFVAGSTKSDAYRGAGYSVENMMDKTVNEEASKLFSNPKVSTRVEELQALALTRQQTTIDKVVAEYAKLAFTDFTEAFYSDGTLKPLNELSPDVRACIAGLEIVEQIIDEDGTTSKTKKIKLVDKRAALDSLAKYLSMFVTVSKVQHTGKDGQDLPSPTLLVTEDVIKSVVKQIHDEF